MNVRSSDIYAVKFTQLKKKRRNVLDYFLNKLDNERGRNILQMPYRYEHDLCLNCIVQYRRLPKLQ